MKDFVLKLETRGDDGEWYTIWEEECETAAEVSGSLRPLEAKGMLHAIEDGMPTRSYLVYQGDFAVRLWCFDSHGKRCDRWEEIP